MAELRWNPLLKTWTISAPERQDRPQMPKDWCPFCPGSGRVPDEYDVLNYDNDFPILSQKPEEPINSNSDLYPSKEAYGKSEIILYSSEHKKNFHGLPLAQIIKVVHLWTDRMEELSKDRKIEYVFIFENKGEEVGVTMPHPHGQIYAFSYIPLKIKTELDNCKDFYEKKNTCLLCKMNEEELNFKNRIIYENEHFLAYIPYFTDYPYGVFIVSKGHKSALTDFKEEEKAALAQILKVITGSFDKIFERPFPYMMALHQRPVSSREYKESEEYFHFHIEFYPPLRAKNKIKFNASSEMGAWAAANIASIEETAKEMRKAKLKYLSLSDRSILKDELTKEFVRLYGGKLGEVAVFSAPARVNLIGEHTDYNGGLVLPIALDLSIYMAIRKRKDGEIILKDLYYPETVKSGINEDIVKTPEIPWANYSKGVIKTLLGKGYRIDSGFEVLFFSEIPTEAGLASSAAFEVVLAYGLSQIFQMGISLENIALLCQKAESDFVGVECGIMDQFAVALSKSGSAMLLNCANLTYETIPVELGNYQIVIANTGKKRKLSSSPYQQRVSECQKALKEVQKFLNLSYLSQLDSKNFEKIKHQITDTVSRKRIRHIVTENERVILAKEALEKHNLKTFGRLLEKSHSSLRDDFEVTGIELDSLFEKARKFEGCIGARMTGAGFGGCTINLVHKDRVEEFKNLISKEYFEEMKLAPTFTICGIGNGVKRI
jgi:UDPglucose--hexose-1-phosphate uridylyltransferase